MTSDQIIRKRTRDIYHFHESELWAAAYGPRAVWPAPGERVRLPWSVEFFRHQVDATIQAAGKCPYCSDWITVTNFSLDHMIPVSRRDEFRKALVDYVEPQHWQGRGKHIDPVLIAAYTWDNLTLCCLTCNKRKGTMTAVGWALLRHTMGMMNDGDKQYLWKQLLLSEHRYIPKKDRPEKFTVRPHSRRA